MFAPDRVSSLAHDGENCSQGDPFWQATPRSLPSSNIGSSQPGGPQTQTAPVIKQARQSPLGAVRRPQCTHTIVTRVYDERICFMCGKVPQIGWLYICRQDCELSQDAADPDEHPRVSNESGYFEVQASLAESLSIGAGVIEGMRCGDYTIDQIDKLIEQRRHVLAVIRQEENPTAADAPEMQIQRTKSTRKCTLEDVIASVGSSMAPSPPPLSDLRLNTEPTKADASNATRDATHKIKRQPCNFQVCHTCRPFFKDRLYQSFEQALSGREPPVTEDNWQQLPVFNVAIVRNLGLRTTNSSPPSPHIANTPASQHDGKDEETSDWTPTSVTISETDSESLDEATAYPCPGAGVCPLYSRYAGCAYEHSFDDGLRALNHGFGPEPDLTRMTPENSETRLGRIRGGVSDTPGGSVSTASSVSLPTPNAVPLTPITPTDECFEDALMMRMKKKPGKAATISGPFLNAKPRKRLGFSLRGRDSHSSLGSEVEVEGGVALTEEAVRAGIPDILADNEGP
ncbi:hypothetical protein LTR78_000526 [Recurvomyces mirabilis]|uniref:Uncharacterized protein n=1 Tax=Recurvomyces mirabilis TaxID=574656 RepID=A0AAE1C6M3_9PEZI|nr:hypothetical protein LTR78_000526 [Recurvomyces mirabilis]KAK5162180.1 hypothetical protein LTS14_000526 [Recurvomyces mirabilis]